ncbi:VCBS domain-containing protein, partial [Bradyrhizobium sp. CCBAU 51745]
MASQDGTASGTVTVTITGSNDAATVSSEAKSVTEGDTAATLNTSG